jgi:hypothetical protein
MLEFYSYGPRVSTALLLGAVVLLITGCNTSTSPTAASKLQMVTLRLPGMNQKLKIL